MLDGIEERLHAPAQPDDPAEIRARFDALRQQIHQRDNQRAADDDFAQQLTDPARTQPSTDTAADNTDGDDSGRGW
jgi:hypothetical protein